MKLRIGLILLSSILIIIGISIKTKLYYKEYIVTKKEQSNIINYIENKDYSNYVGVIDIPRIDLKRGIIKDSNVDQDITIIDYNKFLMGNIILASHSGNCDICFFKDLELLKIGDLIYFYRNNIKYSYKINSIKEKKKNTFKLDDGNNILTLITCKKNSNDIQIIIKSILISEEKYFK